MKKSLIAILAMLLMLSCQVNELAPEYVPAEDDLYASIESLGATKTVMDENNNVLWSEEDQLVAFMGTTLGTKYQIKEQYVGTTTGGFSKIDEAGNEEDLESGQEIDHNVVLYPHSTSVWCMKNDSNNPTQAYKLNVILPETQAYEENSFGIGAFPMIAVSTDNKLTFRNICGGLKLQFKGVDKIKSIKLEGLGGEKISGKSTVVGYVNGSTPTIAMAATDKSYSHVILDCGEGVQLSEATPTTFIIAVPPVEFASGMKITVTDTDGLSRTLTNSSANTIKRSCLTRFPVITYKQDGVFELPEGTLTSHEIPAEGGTVEIPLTTNQEYEVVIPEDAQEWISVVETRVVRNETVVLNIAENTTAEDRTAEVLIAATDGTTLQTITVSQDAGAAPSNPNDYIDEYGINHGPGIEIDGVTWAPVNCGYHAEDFKYGKLYQWGRKYGQGYSGIIWNLDNGVSIENGTYADAIIPEIVDGPVSIHTGEAASNFNNFYTSNSYPYTWFETQSENLWNEGQDFNPVKTSYDPCPAGWRVPYIYELLDLSRNHSTWTSKDGQNGYWCSGYTVYKEDVPRVFLPAAGETGHSNGGGGNRGIRGNYWSSTYNSQKAQCSQFSYSTPPSSGYGGVCAYGYSVRCVKDSTPSTPAEPEVVNLSQSGTANSYIVTSAGSYTFSTLKGNSSESVGAVASAEVLWESFGTDVIPNVGDLVKNAVYSDGHIAFQTADKFKKGNAVIAAKDASGNILWSWHIWLTDEPEGQEYYNNAGIMMDRNLGATSATPGDVGALGLLYQWGRKDPFLGSSSISSPTFAKSTVTWPSAVSSDSSNGTIAYATANPTTFIKYSSNNSEWYYTGSSSTDNTRWTTSESSKSIYDPCPAGWRVPDGGSNGIWSKALGSSSSFTQSSLYDSTNEGMNFSGKFGSASIIWYPASGYRNGGDGSLNNVGNNNGNVNPSNNNNRANGHSVRCVRASVGGKVS